MDELGIDIVKFQSTFPRGERHKIFTSLTLTLLFQSTFPRGERLGINALPFRMYGFNPRSREGNDSPERSGLAERSCFNPRSREGNDAMFFFVRHPVDVSIHVPARGTTCFLYSLHFSLLFQSTFPRGERQRR